MYSDHQTSTLAILQQKYLLDMRDISHDILYKQNLIGDFAFIGIMLPINVAAVEIKDFSTWISQLSKNQNFWNDRIPND